MRRKKKGTIKAQVSIGFLHTEMDPYSFQQNYGNQPTYPPSNYGAPPPTGYGAPGGFGEPVPGFGALPPGPGGFGAPSGPGGFGAPSGPGGFGAPPPAVDPYAYATQPAAPSVQSPYASGGFGAPVTPPASGAPAAYGSANYATNQSPNYGSGNYGSGNYGSGNYGGTVDFNTSKLAFNLDRSLRMDSEFSANYSPGS